MCVIVRIYTCPKTKRPRTSGTGSRKRYSICGQLRKALFPFVRPLVFARTARVHERGRRALFEREEEGTASETGKEIAGGRKEASDHAQSGVSAGVVPELGPVRSNSGSD